MKALGNKVNKQRKELKEREIQMEERQKLKEELKVCVKILNNFILR